MRVKFSRRIILVGMCAGVAITALIYILQNGSSNRHMDSSSSQSGRVIPPQNQNTTNHKTNEYLRSLEQRPEILRGPRYQPFEVGEKTINEELLRLAGIPLERKRELQKIIDDTWARMARDLRDEAILKKEVDSAGDEVGMIHIGANPDQAIKRIKEFADDLTASFGMAATNRLSPYFTEPSYFSGFGKYDLDVKYRLNDDEGGVGYESINVNVTDSITGEKLSRIYLKKGGDERKYLGPLIDFIIEK